MKMDGQTLTRVNINCQGEASVGSFWVGGRPPDKGRGTLEQFSLSFILVGLFNVLFFFGGARDNSFCTGPNCTLCL